MGEEARKWGKIMPVCLFVGGKERVGFWASIGWGLTDCVLWGHRPLVKPNMVASVLMIVRFDS